MEISFIKSMKVCLAKQSPSKQDLLIFGTLLFILFSLPANAQTSPQPVLPQPRPLPDIEPLSPLEDLLPQPTAPETPQPPAFEIPGTIIVNRFEVIGNTVFDAEDLQAVLEPFTGRPISFAELLEAQTAISELYFQEGYITSGAFIPPQALQDGTVQIQVIEGTVEEIAIQGLRRLKPGYIRRRLELAAKPPLNQNRLLNGLQLLQLDPLIETLTVDLSAGVRPGTSTLDVVIKEADAISGLLAFDNLRSPSVGTDRRIVELTHANLLGFSDRANIRYVNTDGSNALDDASYSIPINARNGTLTFRYSRTNSDIIEEPFNDLDIESQTQRYELTYRQPLYQTATTDLAIGFTAERQESQTSLLDRDFPLSPGAEDDGETKLSTLRFFQEWTKRSARDVLAARSQFSLGIDAFNATINNDSPDGEYFAWRGQAQYLRLLGADTLLLLRTDLQLSDRPLVPLEQFSLGGQLSVRGYRQDALLADNGMFASAEVRIPVFRIPEWQTVMQVTPFVDFGTVGNNRDSDLDENTLWSVGLGLRLNIGNNLNARIEWGIPLVDLDDRDKDSLQENGIYFRLEYRPF